MVLDMVEKKSKMTREEVIAIGTKNMIPVHLRSKEEAKQMSLKGGYASGVARRKKKELADRFKLGFETLGAFASEKLKDQEAKKLLDETGYEVYCLLNIATSSKNSDSVKLQAWNSILDRTYSKPVTKTEHSLSVPTLNQTEQIMLQDYDTSKYLEDESKD